ncbi:hypothetical protein SALBM217S_01251 [Streptomyces griseoloalbus]
MDARLYRHVRRSLTGLLVGAFLAGGVWGSPLASARPGAAAQADVPPQEPGVTLRVFDVQVPLEKICTLKPGQTPNVDRLAPVVDFTSTADFGGIADNFVSQVTGNIHVPAPGSYTFRLTSDDGSRLLIDDQVVIDHDGLHGAEPKDGTVELTEGMHALRIDHFERGGGEQLTLAWHAARRRRLHDRAERGAEHATPVWCG